jgi:broad specificity phosphatase PhoE
MPRRIYLIRHGETEGNAAGRFVGSLDLPLSPRGQRQVRLLAERLETSLGGSDGPGASSSAGSVADGPLAAEDPSAAPASLAAGSVAPDSGGVDPSPTVSPRVPVVEARCVASPLLRAQQTAKIVSVHLGLAFDTDSDLREIDFGAWEGLTAEEIEKRYPGALAQWISPREETAFPGGESLREFDGRVERALARIVAERTETVLVFAHGGVVRALICGLLGLGPEGFWLFEVKPATVARIDLHDGRAVLAELWPAEAGGVG